MGSHRRRLCAIFLLGLAGAGCAGDTPPPGAGAHALHEHVFASDVVIVIDHSSVALLASGFDVDEDGVVGRNRRAARDASPEPWPARFWTTDSGDTIQALQLRVARALVLRLAERKSRVGLLSSTQRARKRGTSLVRLTDKPAVVVPVGPPEAALAALADFPAARERRRTDLARLLAHAAELLEAAPAADTGRPRTIVLLSVGEPSAPDGIHWSSQRALELARQVGQRGIALWAIPFGTPNPAFLDELTRSGGGSVVPLGELDARLGGSDGAGRGSAASGLGRTTSGRSALEAGYEAR